jgi:hypothetical protein
MQTIITQEDFYKVGLLPLRDALNRTGWEWICEIHYDMVFVDFSPPDKGPLPGRLYVGPLVMAFEGSDFNRLFCSVGDGSGKTGQPNQEFVFMSILI